MSLTELEAALAAESITADLPTLLPLAHLTIARSFELILNAGYLQPRPCKVLKSDLLYFSYGGLFYRGPDLQSQQPLELPIGLVFDPRMFTTISELFPFDSGAMSAMRFGADWFDKLRPFEARFAVHAGDLSRAAQELVLHLFETNSNYIKGVPSTPSTGKRQPLPLLHDFLAADLTSLNVDHRQRTIEAIARVTVSLGQHLLWIGLPQLATSSRLRQLYRWTKPTVTQAFEYDYHANSTPASIAELLEAEASKDVVNRYARLGAS